jgi:hypothetical protein
MSACLHPEDSTGPRWDQPDARGRCGAAGYPSKSGGVRGRWDRGGSGPRTLILLLSINGDPAANSSASCCGFPPGVPRRAPLRAPGSGDSVGKTGGPAPGTPRFWGFGPGLFAARPGLSAANRESLCCDDRVCLQQRYPVDPERPGYRQARRPALCNNDGGICWQRRPWSQQRERVPPWCPRGGGVLIHTELGHYPGGQAIPAGPRRSRVRVGWTQSRRGRGRSPPGEGAAGPQLTRRSRTVSCSRATSA